MKYSLGACLVFLATALPVRAPAQIRESTDASLRDACLHAGQVLTTGTPAAERAWAMSVIGRCEQSGPPVLAELWQEVQPDTVALGELVWRSVVLRDNRLYAAVQGVAANPAIPDAKRLAAISLLGRWAFPHLSLGFAQFLRADAQQGPGAGHTITSLSHDGQTEGAEPLPASVRAEVHDLLVGLASDPSERVRFAAGILEEYLRPD